MAITHLGRMMRARIEEETRRRERLFWEGGGAQEFAEYRYQAGFIAGINAAMAILEELENV